jgi:hypothetical protein
VDRKIKPPVRDVGALKGYPTNPSSMSVWASREGSFALVGSWDGRIRRGLDFVKAETALKLPPRRLCMALARNGWAFLGIIHDKIRRI